MFRPRWGDNQGDGLMEDLIEPMAQLWSVDRVRRWDNISCRHGFPHISHGLPALPATKA
jgi:hypothetical protein